MDITLLRIHLSLINCSLKSVFLRFYNKLKFHIWSGTDSSVIPRQFLQSVRSPVVLRLLPALAVVVFIQQHVEI